MVVQAYKLVVRGVSSPMELMDQYAPDKSLWEQIDAMSD